MNWHYVFETAPLWCLWFALISTKLITAWRAQGRRALIVWWSGLLLIAVLTSYVPVTGLWNQCRIEAAIGEVKFPRNRYASFAAKLNQLPPAPGLVLIEGDPSDRSFDLVVNNPEFHDRILRARFLPGQIPVARVKQLFPDRRVYRYRVREDRFERAD